MTPGPGRRLSSQDQPGTAPQLRAVCLVGFMGAGKTSVGQVLAQQLGWPFIDLDQSIEQRHQCSIAEMFRKAGEAEFRRAEHAELRAVLQQLSPSRPAVVALGGGAFVQDDNVALLRDSQAACIFLDAPVEETMATSAHWPVPRTSSANCMSYAGRVIWRLTCASRLPAATYKRSWRRLCPGSGSAPA